ncbi:M56 family metallopeptidase [Flavobacterium pallidum]|uniref:Peptidase M56 domain-containing protein n=1 Tax=Flavobacterium pallidum TaxID=2172098 RepID=A0A2S1SHZ9_9FLAO|nr:M56 family metallopeptidase [Flavobacterium pallidum]AWI25989.1 hypothetical protein HYN49_08800 [Flavobacterium pallidum]
MIFSDNIIKAVSWTLVHSIWQGIFVAVLAGIIILVTKKSAAVLRYNLLSLLFIVFLVSVWMTFNYEFSPEVLLHAGQLDLPLLQQQIIINPGAPDFVNTVFKFVNDNSYAITLIWLVIFGFKLLGIFNAFGKIYRVRNYKTFSPSEYWKNRVSELALQINLSKPVLLLESALVKIPCVTGYFKPIILLPFGMLSSLPQDQIEAILLHELAHIRRKDYIVNLLQYLAETIFFFNPGLLWLSSLIKDERENCCDDIALGIIGNKTDLVHALISFEEYNSQKLSVAFAGKKNPLLQRVKRIVYDDNKSLNVIEKTFLSVSLILVALVVTASVNPHFSGGPIEMQEPKEIVKAAEAAEESPVAEESSVAASDLYKDSAEAVETDEQPDATGNEQSIPVYNYGYQTAEPAPACKPESIARTAPAEVSKTTSVTTRTVNSKTKTAHTFDREVTTYDSDNPAKRGHATLRTGITGENLPDDMNVDNLTTNIISDLITENIITDTRGLSFKLSGNSLIVNGQKQCETVHAKLKRKYFKPKVSAICYNYEYSGDL